MLASSSRAVVAWTGKRIARSTSQLHSFCSTAPIRNAQSGDTYQQSPPSARTKLLLESLPRVPIHGFTRQAYLSQPVEIESDEVADRSRVLDTLFPGPSTVFESELFAAWNQIQDLQAIHQLSAEHITQLFVNGRHPDLEFDGSDAGRSKVETKTSLSNEETQRALLKVQSIVEDRLRSYWDVRQHLIHGITVFSSYSVSTSRFHAIFPHRSILPSLPDPGPMLSLSSRFISDALNKPAAQVRTGWLDSDSSDWYAVRARLISAYLATTLHISSGQIAHFEESQRFFRQITRGRDSGFVASLGTAVTSGRDWAQWGGRGWLGIIRSLGL